MAAQLFYLPFRPAIDANGLTVPGAQLFFYETGTTTKRPIYSDDALTVELTNPVEANAAGVWPSIYLDEAIVYRCVLKDAAGVTLDDQDPYLADVADDLTSALTSVANAAAASASSASASAVAASDDADDARAAAIVAQAFTGPLYGDTATGLAATVDGEGFAVDEFDGTASVYLNQLGVATFIRPIIIDPSNPGTAALIGTTGGNLQSVLDGMGPSGGTVLSVDISGGSTGLTASGGPITTSGTITLAGTLAVANGGTGSTSAANARTALSAAARSQTTEQISGFIASPTNKTYRIALKMAHGGTITETTTRSASGTCTATFAINTTPLGGTANSVSSTEQSQAHASANVFAAGDDIELVVSANSSCADMSFTIVYTRVLA